MLLVVGFLSVKQEVQVAEMKCLGAISTQVILRLRLSLSPRALVLKEALI